MTIYRSGQDLPTGRINHYVTDGEITLARLATQAA